MKNRLLLALSAVMLSTPALAVEQVDQESQFGTTANIVQTSNASTQTNTKPIFYGDDGAYPFSTAVRVGNTLYMSGQLGMKDGKLVNGGVKAETEQALDNINATLLKYGYQKSDLVKCMAMLTDMNDFNAFNEGYKAKLTSPYPVRSAFEVSGLALGATVEIECMAVK